jgi:hypothetical protein
MLEWLVPLSAFWIIAALFMGGSPAEVEGGGGGRQLLGLIVSLVLYLAVWWGVRAGLRAAVPAPAALVVATLVAAALIPVWCRLAYRVVGLKVVGPTFIPGHAAH